jgi:hypothetical protein
MVAGGGRFKSRITPIYYYYMLLWLLRERERERELGSQPKLNNKTENLSPLSQKVGTEFVETVQPAQLARHSRQSLAKPRILSPFLRILSSQKESDSQ